MASVPPPPPPGFKLDEDAKPRKASPPPPPPGFQLDEEEEPEKRPVVVPEAVDGDTLRTQAGPNLRLWGVDAPELKQPGYLPGGGTVPVGEQSKASLADLLLSGTPLAGQPEHFSYGRPVGPVTVDGADAGQYMARTGNALAAPEYLSDDPARRFDYLQAERLARQNRLGLHDTYTQPPAEYRADPDYVVPRETVAQFFDDPTPEAGMRPEVEQKYLKLLNDPEVTPQQVADYARANGGFIVDPVAIGEAKAQAARTGQSITFDYNQGTMPLTDAGDGAAGAYVRGVGSGALAGGLDEAGAFADTFIPEWAGGTQARENVYNSERRWADIWANNRQQNASILGYDETAHPYATTGGEITGALVVPFGARAKTVGELARVGGAYGAAEGFLGTEGTVWDRAKGAAIQAPAGAILGAAGGKAIEYAGPRAMRVAEALSERLRGGGKPIDVPAPPEGFTLDPVDARAMDAETSITSELSLPRQRDVIDVSQPRPVSQPMTEAQLRAASDNIAPRDVLPMASNQVADIEDAAAIDAGRIAPAKPVNERTELTRQTVRNYMGAEVPKVGPVDLIGFVRLRGGLKDSGDAVSKGGDLKAMGFTNASRKGLDFVGQEARFGPLVNDQTGMSLDDAAQAAWEAGYFPERPSVNEMLDALRETHEGTSRRFLPHDLAEVDRFYGAQTDRFDLEQQLAEGPVFTDRSTPAGEQPFPPVQAYEDWGPTPPDYAGNINLGKLESPQDISRALTQTDKRVGFDAATRGRVTQAETETLASELGMTADDLLSRRKGQALNAEQALASRQILAKSGNELVNLARKVSQLENPGDEVLAQFRQAWMRHVAIQEQVAGATAEAGRALGQFRMMAKSQNVRGDVLGALVRGGGGPDNLKNAAETLLDAVETSPGKFNADSRKLAKPTWRHRISEYYINALLSGPQTHVVNMVSNTLTSMAQIPEFATAAVIGGARQMASRTPIDRITGSEVGARAFGLLQGTKEGAKLFARALRTGEASDFASKVEGEQYKAIPGLAGEIIRVPTRFLTAEDELFKGVARRMELNAQAVRIARKEGLRGDAAAKRIAELVADPTDQMTERALDYGRYLTFQRQLGPVGSKVSGLTNDSLVIKVFLPFVRTPTNLIKFAAERSPAAPLLQEWRKDFAAGGERRDLAVARALLGTGFGVVMYEAALEGKITGSAPSDPKKARLLYADGWQPYSVKIGDQWYSYKRLDPFSTTIGVAADLATIPEGMSARQKQDKAMLLAASIMGNLASKTWLSGVSDLVSAIDEPDRYADNMIQRLVGSFLVPSLAGQVARTMDPTRRQAETVGEALQSRTPGMSDNLIPRRDVWGRPIVNEGGLGPDFISPVWVSTQLEDPVNSELLKLDYAPGYPSKKVGGRELSPEEYDHYHAQAGQLSHERLTQLVTSPGWKSLDYEEKTKAAKKTVDVARDDVRAELFEGGEGDGGGISSQGSVPPPPGFAIDGEAGGRNVYQDLQEAIPGVRFTSGYRDEAYQADMRRRGYKPASNSGHLDGSSFDLIPPEGRSMGWLKAQVKRYDRKARLLDEGDHLHVTFPGYYGAPPIGGAAETGLANPYAGMPPPPAGFTLDR